MTARQPVLVPAALARGLRGAVVAPHHLATAAGLWILAAGGSAVDAAIATNAVLGVVMPSGCGIGGDAFWLIWDSAAGREFALNGSGRAPAAADPAALRRDGLETIPVRGPLTVTVPGAVRSWGDAHTRFGRLSRAEILAPAIELARDGFAAWDGFISAVEGTLPACRAAIGADSGFERVYRPNGRPWRPGERSDCRPWQQRSRGWPRSGSTTSTTARSANGRPAAWPLPVPRSPSTTCATIGRRGRSRSPPTTEASG
jgi:gamma-glutamyltranspeptidase